MTAPGPRPDRPRQAPDPTNHHGVRRIPNDDQD